MKSTLELIEPTAHGEETDGSLWLYRDRTIALLRRYFRLSLQVGRLPSLLGREILQFRAPVSDYGASTFEDAVIFVHDIERCLDKLEPLDHDLIVLIVLEERTQVEAARIVHSTHRTIARIFPAAVDRISKIFLEHGILREFPVIE
jgi:DNA-directed RNA polymerase specialized sigma24 family protein